MIINCSNLEKSFPEKTLFSNLSFMLENGDRLGILGANGCGKSTLLKIIVGEMNSDSGSVILSPDIKIGYLSQYQGDDIKGKIYDVVLSSRNDLIEKEKSLKEMEEDMSKLSGDELKTHIEKYNKLLHDFEDQGGMVYKSMATGILKGLGFPEEDFDKDFDSLSGGQKTRVSLGRLLLYNPDLLILDEPTNHLDIHSVEWLETFLSNYKKTIILVSHDRYFLDHVVDHCLELNESNSRLYKGNYTEVQIKIREQRIADERAYNKQQDKIAHEEKVIETLQRFNREKSIKRAESRKKVLDKIERLDAPKADPDSMHLEFKSGRRSGNDVLEISDLSKSFDDASLFSDISFYVGRGDRLAILGDNGTGKTTLLRIINGLLKADSGTVKIGASVDIGYYDQGQQNLDDSNTVFSELRNTYPYMNDTGIRNVLAAFDFKGDSVLKSVKALSGGERGRLSLAKLMLLDANLLILDEPTNHLDIKSKEVLEEALMSYDGTIVFVSHDRYFINKIADRIIVLNNNSIDEFLGNYDDYLEKIAESDSVENNGTYDVNSGQDSSKVDYEQQKKDKAARKKIEKEYADIEKEIEKLEELISETEEEMMNPEISSDSSKLNELNTIIQKSKEKLDILYIDWEKLSEELS